MRNRRKIIEKNDDLITLKGCGYTTIWRFPMNMKRCPNSRCNFISKDRSETIAHYRKHHAMSAILCYLCNKPISIGVNTKSTYNYMLHYKNGHPNVKDPFDFVGKTRLSEGNVKSSNKLRCPLKECDFRADNDTILRAHWTRQHNDLRFPEMRQETNHLTNNNEYANQADLTNVSVRSGILRSISFICQCVLIFSVKITMEIQPITQNCLDEKYVSFFYLH